MILLDESTREILAPAVSILLHGLTGGGKSTFAETGGAPLVLLFEPKAMAHLRNLNPKAIGFAPECLEDLDGLLAVLGEMHTPQGRPMLLALWSFLYRLDPTPTEEKKAAVLGLAGRLAKVDRIVMDSFTDMTNSLPRWLREKGGAQVGTLVKLELQEYGSLKDYALAVVKAIQLSGLPSVIIARSISKKVGLSESIRPDGAGSSVNDLPGKLLPTAEGRVDPERGFVVDTTPAEHSQRCGLPWVPAVFKGSCLDYIRIIQAGPQASAEGDTLARGILEDTAKAREIPGVKSNTSMLHRDAPAVASGTPQETAKPVAPVTAHFSPTAPPAPPKASSKRGHKAADKTPIPGAGDSEWENLMFQLAEITITRPVPERQAQVASWEASYGTNPDKAKADLDSFIEATRRLAAMGTAPDPERDPDGYKDAFAAVCTTLQEERRAKDPKFPQEVLDFVDGMADGNFGPKDAPAPPAAINPPAMDCQFANALAEFNTATSRAGWANADRITAHKEWEAKGSKGLPELYAAIAKLKAAVPAVPVAPAADGRPPRATPEDITEILDLAATHKADLSSLWKYAQVKGEAKPTPDGSPNWYSVSAIFVERIAPQLREDSKRRAFLPWLHATYPSTSTK